MKAKRTEAAKPFENNRLRGLVLLWGIRLVQAAAYLRRASQVGLSLGI